MQKPKIYAKSIINEQETNIKFQIGCDGIELQLYNQLDGYENLNNITVVHSPIIDGNGLTIEEINSTKGYELLYKSCEMANYFGEKQNKDILVVVHTESSLLWLESLGILSTIEQRIQELLRQFPRIKIAIENVSSLRTNTNSDLHLCNGFKFDNVDIVKYLREALQTDKIGTCVDTCHALMTELYMQPIFNLYNSEKSENYTLEEFFKANKDICFLIHLSDMKCNGIGKNHGVPFDETNQGKCYQILELYRKYNYICPITLEVREDDYMVCDGYKTTKEVVDKFYWHCLVLNIN